MKTKTDISYGVIPVRRTAEGIELLLIHQYSKIKDNTYWTFPKGHPKDDETPHQSATRELQEETGLQVKQFLSDEVFKTEYTFVWDGVLIEKTAVFFLATVEEGILVPQEAEVKAMTWTPLDDVYDKLDHDGNKQMFLAVQDVLAAIDAPSISGG